MKTKLIVFGLLALVVGGICALWGQAVEPVVSTKLALANVNGTDGDWQALTVFTANKYLIKGVLLVLLGIVGMIMFIPKKVGKNLAMLGALTIIGLSTSGCMQPYDVPEFKDIKPNETAFVIPLDIDGNGQVKFNSAQFLESKKVASKRIQVMHRWVQEGRMIGDGKYIPTVVLIVVDRQPVTQEWVVKEGNTKGKDNAIWTESADSVGFSMGWTATAYIKEEDASNFLYFYPSAGLVHVMNTEIRGRVQKIAANFSAQYKLDMLRDKKNEMAKAVEADVIEFFKTRGITITMVGMFGGMNYENPKIQEAIDNTFVSQQEKVNAKAFLDAQEDKNKKINSEATALAEASRSKAKGEADGIEFINVALAKANNNPQLIELRQIEVEKARIEKWNGTYPSTVAGAGAQTWVGLSQKDDVTPVAVKK